MTMNFSQDIGSVVPNLHLESFHQLGLDKGKYTKVAVFLTFITCLRMSEEYE